MERHPGISIHHIAIGGGVVGVIVAVGSCLIFFLGVREVRWFLFVAIPFGICISFAIYFWHRRKPVELTGVDDETRMKLS